MILQEYIFNGYLIACSCGQEHHAPAKDIIELACECGHTLEVPRSIIHKNWECIERREIEPEDFTLDAFIISNSKRESFSLWRWIRNMTPSSWQPHHLSPL